MRNNLGWIRAEGCMAFLQRNSWRAGIYTGHKHSRVRGAWTWQTKVLVSSYQPGAYRNFTQIWDHSWFLQCSVCPLGTSIWASLFVLSVPLTFSLPLLLLSVEKTVKSVEVALQSRFWVLNCSIKTAKKKGRKEQELCSQKNNRLFFHFYH